MILTVKNEVLRNIPPNRLAAQYVMEVSFPFIWCLAAINWSFYMSYPRYGLTGREKIFLYYGL